MLILFCYSHYLISDIDFPYIFDFLIFDMLADVLIYIGPAGFKFSFDLKCSKVIPIS